MGKYELLSDEHLMTAIYNGNTVAFNELYQRYSKRLLYYFYRMLGNSREKSQDFLQDIFVKIIEKPEMFDTDRKFSTWIFSVAHNMCKNEYRRQAVRNTAVFKSDFEEGSGLNEPDVNESIITAQQIYESMECLGENEKTAFLLYYREDFSLQEIAIVLSMPEGTVKSKLFYARKKLIDKLGLNHLNK